MYKIQPIRSRWVSSTNYFKESCKHLLTPEKKREHKITEQPSWARLGGVHMTSIHLLLTTKPHGSTGRRGGCCFLQTVDMTKNNGGQSAFSVTLLDGPLENKPRCQRQTVELFTELRAVHEEDRNNPRRCRVLHSPSPYVSSKTQSHDFRTPRSSGGFLDSHPPRTSQEDTAESPKGKTW